MRDGSRERVSFSIPGRFGGRTYLELGVKRVPVTGIEFHFCCAKIEVCLRFPAGSSSPPDCCI